VALESWLNRTVPQELVFQVEDAYINGNGVGKPSGIMQSACLVSVTRLDANTVKKDDIFKMFARRWAGVNDYVWLINTDVLPQIWDLNNTYQALYVPPGGIRNDPYGTLLGRPVIETEYNATMGTTGDIILASLSQYQTIRKGGVQAASSIHVQFLTDETCFRFVYRTDGSPLWSAPLTPFKGSNTQSPFVALTTAST
jgi:HK97 family phage major capsid protein